MALEIDPIISCLGPYHYYLWAMRRVKYIIDLAVQGTIFAHGSFALSLRM